MSPQVSAASDDCVSAASIALLVLDEPRRQLRRDVDPDRVGDEQRAAGPSSALAPATL
jgi:hypothetical protein